MITILYFKKDEDFTVLEKFGFSKVIPNIANVRWQKVNKVSTIIIYENNRLVEITNPSGRPLVELDDIYMLINKNLVELE